MSSGNSGDGRSLAGLPPHAITRSLSDTNIEDMPGRTEVISAPLHAATRDMASLARVGNRVDSPGNRLMAKWRKAASGATDDSAAGDATGTDRVPDLPATKSMVAPERSAFVKDILIVAFAADTLGKLAESMNMDLTPRSRSKATAKATTKASSPLLRSGRRKHRVRGKRAKSAKGAPEPAPNPSRSVSPVLRPMRRSATEIANPSGLGEMDHHNLDIPSFTSSGESSPRSPTSPRTSLELSATGSVESGPSAAPAPHAIAAASSAAHLAPPVQHGAPASTLSSLSSISDDTNATASAAHSPSSSSDSSSSDSSDSTASSDLAPSASDEWGTVQCHIDGGTDIALHNGIPVAPPTSSAISAADILRHFNFSDVYEAPDPEDALIVLDSAHVDLIVLDIEVGGVQVAHSWLRTLVKQKMGHIPRVFAIFPRNSVEIIAAFMADGVVDYLVKPFVPAALAHRVRGLAPPTMLQPSRKSSLPAHLHRMGLARGRAGHQHSAIDAMRKVTLRWKLSLIEAERKKHTHLESHMDDMRTKLALVETPLLSLVSRLQELTRLDLGNPHKADFVRYELQSVISQLASGDLFQPRITTSPTPGGGARGSSGEEFASSSPPTSHQSISVSRSPPPPLPLVSSDDTMTIHRAAAMARGQKRRASLAAPLPRYGRNMSPTSPSTGPSQVPPAPPGRLRRMSSHSEWILDTFTRRPRGKSHALRRSISSVASLDNSSDRDRSKSPCSQAAGLVGHLEDSPLRDAGGSTSSIPPDAPPVAGTLAYEPSSGVEATAWGAFVWVDAITSCVAALVADATKHASLTLSQARHHIDTLSFAATSLSKPDLIVCLVAMFDAAGVMAAFGLSEELVYNFVVAVSHLYKSPNPYHNFVHAADVTQSVYYYITHSGAADLLTPLDSLALLCAAVAHDVNHPGLNNDFLVAVQAPLARLYNDNSVLENHHAALLFRVLSSPACDITSVLSADQTASFRAIAVHAILVTDMASHFEIMGQFQVVVQTRELDPTSESDRKLLAGVILHAADISNPTRPLAIFKDWADMVFAEFLAQGDRERDIGLPVTPIFDRETSMLAPLEVNFIKFVVQPFFSVFVTLFPELSSLLENMLENFAYFEALS
ncbi:uncharacterized protein AMSG_09744 [Thecamonas trahens ATCC 50062]|uniref:Phosphodiesterase n=1 Tax=Thecamonas trahens ATCC 50062 TaxID=461836 RepID=A0A0L0DP61_THETB|nr:hypothetical protein AMSG_09744 [Thecamonas trahens ATCC 50062]KNC54079.1 hypothetical protein AMSG_09744 [Thecamonas trahens ATCC 50062]|eukprot:XP_013754088.1 hypothetical protein AMSG_09744 [Thecamonas trahens ATCC 50062]